mmetsp:Transcript_20180/g.68459  ORF Transcript_20180/g.68459 Transcript_20180/m.68459 type:complete len:295 (+) Transcript_20180:458-1342(+)
MGRPRRHLQAPVRDAVGGQRGRAALPPGVRVHPLCRQRQRLGALPGHARARRRPGEHYGRQPRMERQRGGVLPARLRGGRGRGRGRRGAPGGAGAPAPRARASPNGPGRPRVRGAPPGGGRPGPRHVPRPLGRGAVLPGGVPDALALGQEVQHHHGAAQVLRQGHSPGAPTPRVPAAPRAPRLLRAPRVLRGLRGRLQRRRRRPFVCVGPPRCQVLVGLRRGHAGRGGGPAAPARGSRRVPEPHGAGPGRLRRRPPRAPAAAAAAPAAPGAEGATGATAAAAPAPAPAPDPAAV